MGLLVFWRGVPAPARPRSPTWPSGPRGRPRRCWREGTASLPFIGVVRRAPLGRPLDAALELTDRGLAAARRSGSIIDFAASLTLRATVLRRAGRLREAEADARVALEAVLDPAVAFARGVGPLVGALWTAGASTTRRASWLRSCPTRSRTRRRCFRWYSRAWRLRGTARARRRAWRLGGGVARGAARATPAWIEDLAVSRACTRRRATMRPRRSSWTRRGAGAEVGTPTALAEALSLGPTDGGDASVDLLREAVAELDGSPTLLIEARARVASAARCAGAGMGWRAAGPARGLRARRACGAEASRRRHDPSCARAASACVARRRGRGALTPSERRIADLAAAGMSNAEVAQSSSSPSRRSRCTHAHLPQARHPRAPGAGAGPGAEAQGAGSRVAPWSRPAARAGRIAAMLRTTDTTKRRSRTEALLELLTYACSWGVMIPPYVHRDGPRP